MHLKKKEKKTEIGENEKQQQGQITMEFIFFMISENSH